MDLQKLEVGQQLCQPCRDETVFNLDNSGAIFIAKFSSPTSTERNAFKNGVAQFKIAAVDGVMFFLARFGATNWMDAPYCIAYSDFVLCRPPEGLGLTLTVVLVDASTGIVKALRTIGLSTTFSSAILDMATQQPTPIDRATYEKTLNQIFSRYTTNDLVDMATEEN